MSGGSINQLIYLRQREAVFRARLVQVGVVDADAPLATRFLDHHHVGRPVRVVDLPDELGR